MNDNSLTLERAAVVVGTQPVCHEGVRSILRLLGIGVLGTADIAAAPGLVARYQPDLLVAEFDGYESAPYGLDCVREACRARPDLVAVVLSADDETELVEAAFAAGAAAYVVKTAQPEDIAVAIRHALDGTTYVLGGATGIVAHVRGTADDTAIVEAPLAATGAARAAGLTRRELEVLRLAAEGRSNRDVAKLLWITDQTVKFHLANVYRKLGVSNRFEAARWARESGLVEHVGDVRPESRLRSVARALAGAGDR